MSSNNLIAYQQLQRRGSNHLGESANERGQSGGGGAVRDSVRLNAGRVDELKVKIKYIARINKSSDQVNK